jgi:hypothetical protein
MRQRQREVSGEAWWKKESQTICGRGESEGRLAVRYGGRRSHIPSADEAKAKGGQRRGMVEEGVTYGLWVRRRRREVSGEGWRKKRGVTYGLWVRQRRKEVNGEGWQKKRGSHTFCG